MTAEQVYGRRAVHEALRGPREVLELWATERAVAAEEWLRDNGGPRVHVKLDRELSEAAGTRDHQGVVARVEPFKYADAYELAKEQSPLLVCLDRVTDPRNLGAVARSVFQILTEHASARDFLSAAPDGTTDNTAGLQAFLDCGAMQCGYCTTGMIMSALALLQDKPEPSREEIVRGMNGNVCRCGTYQRIVTAVDGPTLTLKYKDGEKKIFVPADAPIVTYVPGDEADLKPGAKVFILAAKQTDGTLQGRAWRVGRDGVTPPM